MIFSQDFYFANIVIAFPRDEVDLLEQFFLVIFERSHHFQGENCNKFTRVSLLCLKVRYFMYGQIEINVCVMLARGLHVWYSNFKWQILYQKAQNY